jgi:tetratricopeptide (TPR) repeat protein
MKILSSFLGLFSVLIAYGLFKIDIPYILSVILAIIFSIPLISFFKNFYIFKLTHNIGDILNYQCDPKKYIEKNSELLENRILKNRVEYYFLLLNIAVGYFSLGNNEKAILTAHKIPEKKIKENFYFNVAYNYNLGIFYSSKENWQMGKIFLGNLKDIYTILKNLPKNKNGDFILSYTDNNKKYEFIPEIKLREIEIMIEEIEVLLGKENDKFQEAIEFYEKKFKIQNTTYGRCFSKYYLAFAYEELNNFDKMKESLEFVAENGNVLHIAETARDILKNYSNFT